MSNSLSILSFHASEIPIKSVTVFTNGAEIHRHLQVSLKAGLNEIQIQNFVNSIKRNSIRVDGHGPAIIHTVKYETVYGNSDSELPKIKELTNKIKEIEDKIKTGKHFTKIYLTQMDTLDTSMKEVGKNSANGTNHDAMDSMFGYYETKYIEVRHKFEEVQEHINTNTLEQEKIKCELNKYKHKSNNTITIELDNQKNVDNVEVELDISYQVSDASWSPHYDLRVKTENNIHEIQISYFSDIQQQTGEDWNNVELTLSTAQQCLTGSLPKLGATVVRLCRQKRNKPYCRDRCSDRKAVGRERFGSFRRRSISRSRSRSRERSFSPAEVMRQLTTTAEEHVLSTTFTIPNKKSIPTNAAKHKVTITVETLQTYLHYHCVPKKDINVYLMATVINDSDYPILAGPATVYINNSMSSNIQLKLTSCGEQMECPLGIERQVKVTYKPIKKFQRQNGVIYKNSCATNEQQIVVKNTKRDSSILITIHEPIPQSTDEKIRIQLLSPDVPHNPPKANYAIGDYCTVKLPSTGTEMDDLNNILWTEIIEPEHEKEFNIKWTIDYPNDEILEYIKYDEKRGTNGRKLNESSSSDSEY